MSAPSVQAETQPGASLSDLGTLLLLLRRYRGAIALVTIAATLLGTLIALSLPSVYAAKVTILIEARSQQVVQVQEVYDPMQAQANEYISTQYELLRSRSLAERVVDKLKLDADDAFLADRTGQSWSQSLRERIDWWRFLPGLPQPAPAQAASQEARRAQAASMVMARIIVQPLPRTRLVDVSFLSTDPAKAQQIVMALANAYIESGLEDRLEATQRAGRWLTGKLKDLGEELQTAEKALQDYRDQNQIIAVGSNRGLIDSELIENSARQRDAQRIRTELSSTYSRIRDAGGDPARLEQVPALLQDAGVQKARAALLDAEAELKEVQQRYGQMHPQMLAATARIQDARRAYNEQLRNAAAGVRSQYEIAAETERQVAQTVAGTTSRARALDRKQFELGVLERNVQTNRQLYDLFLQRFKETDSTVNYEPINARITDSAQLPGNPALPNRKKIIVLSALIGLICGIGLAGLRRLLSEGLNTVEEFEAITQLPLFGLIPKVSLKRNTSIVKQFLADPRMPFAESVNAVRTAMLLAEVDGRRTCCVVTSAVPNEGKSSLAACLALSFSGSEKTLLLESDLRAPVSRKMLSLPRDHCAGVLEAMMGNATLEEAIYTTPEGLDVLAVSQRPPNPAEAISSMAFAALLKELRGRYQRIIIDSPPIQAASDVLVLARLADSVLFLTRADDTKASTVRRALQQLRSTNAPLLGCVLNRVDVRRHQDAYADYRYAYRYYG